MKKEDAIKKLEFEKRWGYQSPLELFSKEMEPFPLVEQINKGIDDFVVRSVVNVGLNIDKAELLKALRYDRQQYEKGYADAKAKYKPAHTAWIYQTVKWKAGIPFAVCDACKQFGPVGVYCSNCGAFAGEEEGEADG